MRTRTGKLIIAVVLIVIGVVMLLANSSRSIAQVKKRWQYQCFSSQSLVSDKQLQVKFNELGAQGWEFAGPVWVATDHQPVHCFKR